MEKIQKTFKLNGVKLPDDAVKHYSILTPKDIIDKEIGELVKQCKEIFEDDISTENCQMMLYDFNWHCNELLEKFSESDSMNDFLEKNKIDLSIPLPTEEMVISFVQSKSLFKWCPNKFKECKNIIKIDSSDVVEVVCECGFPFCYKCDYIPHSPFPCILLQEWIKQCDEFAFIFKHNNVICPHCYEVYQVDKWLLKDNPHLYLSLDTNTILTCTHCEGIFISYENVLTKPGVFPDYDYYQTLSDKLQDYIVINCTLKSCENVYFMTTVCKIIQQILHKVNPLPMFSFFLDKKYLSQNPTTAEKVSSFELFKVEMERMLDELMTGIEPLTRKNPYAKMNTFEKDSDVSDKALDNVSKGLHQLQTYLEKFLKFINETNGWIFKLPEIQDVYDAAYYDGVENVGNEEADDVDMNDDSDNNMDDDGEGSSSSEVEEEYVDDGEGNTFVLA